MNEEMLKFFVKKGFLLDRETLEFFSQINDLDLSEDVLNKVVMLSKGRVITRAILASYISEIKPMFSRLEGDKRNIADGFFDELLTIEVPKPEENKKEIKIVRREEPSVKILSSNIIPDRKIEVKDFVTHFKMRYRFLRDILKERKELTNLVSIDKIGSNRNFSIIGIVMTKRITKNKNLLLEVEDLTGKVTALISGGKEDLMKKAGEIILDDVIGFKCAGGREIAYVNDLFFSDSHVPEKKKLDEEEYALFISDIHIGSTMFLKSNFEKFINWLKGGGDEDQRDKVEKVKYLFIIGDTVEGVGIHPGQEQLLEIKNIKGQYKELARYLKEIPKHIKIIMCAGQHDAVRVPEPQPPVDKEFAEEICGMENMYLVSNPAMVEIGGNGKGGFKVLMYHGASMHSWIDEVEDLRLGKANFNPSKVVKYMLRHRHLSPMHSGTTYVPGEKEDALVIKESPDIVATGDMHRTDVDMYNNTLIICSSCWQSTTPFEEKVGNIPDPCKVPMLNLKTREIKIMDFT